MSRSLKQRGFTLVEIQVAFVIFLLISIALSGTMYMAARTQSSSGDIVESNSELRAVASFFTQQLSTFLPMRVHHDGKTHPLFLGREDEIFFIGRLSEHSLKGGPWLIHIYKKNNKLQLEFKSVVNGVEDAELIKTAAWMGSNVLTEIESIALKYYHPTNQTWLPRWQRETGFPSKVSIDIEKNDRAWPTIYVTLVTNAASNIHSYLISNDSMSSLNQ